MAKTAPARPKPATSRASCAEKSTDAEQRLWRLLRDRRFSEFKFRRQYACGSYFLDFYCATAKLAVELDGGGTASLTSAPRMESEMNFSRPGESKCCAFGIISCAVNWNLSGLRYGMR